jgi:hypothetical protein
MFYFIDFQSLVTLCLVIIILMSLAIIWNLSKIRFFFKKNNLTTLTQKMKPGINTLEELERLESHLEKCMVDYIDLQFKQLKIKINDLIEQKIKNQVPSSLPWNTKPVQKTFPTSPEPPEKPGTKVGLPGVVDALQACLYLYNDALIDPGKETQFINRYKPVRMDIVKLKDSRINHGQALKFQPSDRGNVYMVKLCNQNSTSFSVFPRFGLMVSASNYSAGIEYLFRCPDFDEQHIYRVSRILTPASFYKKADGRLHFKSQGEILLVLAETLKQ